MTCRPLRTGSQLTGPRPIAFCTRFADCGPNSPTSLRSAKKRAPTADCSPSPPAFHGSQRVQRTDVTGSEEIALRLMVKMEKPTPSKVASLLKKTPQYVGRIMTSLAEKGLIIIRSNGRNKRYAPSLDAVIAYSE